MKRNAPSIASFFDLKSKTAYPPTTSLASVKGPSVAVTRPPESRTRVLAAVGASPPLAIIVPALTASSLSFAMASMSSLGGGPEFFSADLTSIINRIVTPLLCVFVFRFGAEFPDGFARACIPASTVTSNVAPRNRQGPEETLADVSAAASRARRSACCSRIGGGVLAGFVYLSKLALTITGYLEEILGHFDGLCLRVCLEDGEAADHFLGLGERPVGHAQLPARDANARAESAWQATLGGEQCAGLHLLFDQLAHPGHFLLRRRNAPFRALIDA